MASISEPLLGAGATAKNDWAKAEAATSLTFTGEAEFRRGIEVEIGLEALASAEAGLSKFIDASVRGNAFAEASASLRLQLPLNLFDDFGLAVGAQAVAQAAAGLEVGLGLSVGDFIALIRGRGDSVGLPLDLVILLLDEAVIGGKFEVHVAAAAMAYASITITGQVVKDPGFHITADAGAGVAAGVGFGGSLDIGLRDFRRFYGRAVDLTVGSVVDGLVRQLPDDLARFEPQLRTLAPAAATALRMAYEIGDYLARNQPKQGSQDALDLANHCVGIVLEEAQRYLFGRFLEAGLGGLRRLVEREVPKLQAGAWAALMPQRRALAAALRRMPAEPFQPNADNAAYWSDLIAKGTDLAAQLPAGGGTEIVRGLAMVFAASSLLTAAIRSRVNVAQSYAFAIGAGQARSPQPRFDQPLNPQPARLLREHINGVLGRGAGQSVDYVDLVAYLAKDAIVATLRSAVPVVDEFLAIFQDPKIAGNLADVLRALLNNREAFVIGAAGSRDPQETLRVLLGALDAFISIKIDAELLPVLRARIADDNVRLYFEEVLLGTLLYTKDVAFRTVLDWDRRPVDRAAFTEALSGVMTMLVGRSLVLVADGFLAALQADMARACNHAAKQLDGLKDPFKAIGIPASPELKVLLADVLRVGGEVFGPLPEATRAALRATLYDVFEALPPGAAAQANFTDNLADQFFIPNQDRLQDVADQLIDISRERFQLFVEGVLQAGGAFVLGLIEDFIAAAVRTAIAWANELGKAIDRLFDAIKDLDRVIAELTAAAQQAFEDAGRALEALLEQFADRRLRTRLRDKIAKKAVREANSLLAEQPLYRGLPREAKRFVKDTLAGVVEGLIEGPVLDPLFDALGAAANELDGILDDAAELNPHRPLPPQLLDLVIDRLEDRVRDVFGGTTPHVNVGFTVTVLGLSQRFNLGRVDLPFGTLFSALRDAIGALSFYQAQLDAAADALADAFRKAVDLDAKQDQRARARSDLDRLDRIRSEFTTAPKTITIVDPAQSLAYDDDVEVRIHFSGVAPSYFGLQADEQQRVLVFLNGDLVPPSTFAIDGAPGAAPAGRATVSAGAAAAIVGRAAGALPLSPLLREAAAVKRGASSRPFARQSVTAVGAAPVVTTTVRNVLPGRRMTPSKRAALETALPAGAMVSFRAERGDLVAGVNTLVAVVIDPGGRRYQQMVSFVVAVVAPTPAGVTLPALPGRVPPRIPAATASGLDAHLDVKSFAAKVKTGRDAFTRNAGVHVQTLRGR